MGSDGDDTAITHQGMRNDGSPGSSFGQPSSSPPETGWCPGRRGRDQDTGSPSRWPRPLPLTVVVPLPFSQLTSPASWGVPPARWWVKKAKPGAQEGGCRWPAVRAVCLVVVLCRRTEGSASVGLDGGSGREGAGAARGDPRPGWRALRGGVAGGSLPAAPSRVGSVTVPALRGLSGAG